MTQIGPASGEGAGPDRLLGGAAAPSFGASLLQFWEELPEAIVVLDSGWQYRYLNAAALVLLGLTAAVVGRDSREVHPQAAGSAFGPAYVRVMSGGGYESVESHYEPLDTYLRANIAPWPGGGVVIVLQDVTAERRLQARVRRDLTLYQQLLEHTTQAITLRDLDGRLLLANSAAAARFGRPADEIIGLTMHDVLPAEVAHAVRDIDERVLETGEAQENSASHQLHPSRTVVSQIFPVRDNDGAIIGLGTTLADVTELVDAQAELAASQRRFRQVFGTTSLGVLVTHADGRIIDANTAICRMLDYPRSRLLAMRGPDLVAPERVDPGVRLQRLETEGEQGYEIEDELIRSDGRSVPVLMTINVFDDPVGGGKLTSSVVRDMTVLHQLRERLVQVERMHAVGELAAGIAHDANNILAAVSGYAELLAEQVQGLPAAERQLAGINRSIARANQMVAGLLADTGGERQAPTIIDLAELVHDLQDMLGRLLPDGVVLELDTQPAYAWADASQIRQVVLNLVVNARNAVAGAGSICLSTRSDERHAVLSVTDDGPGMSADVARRCFEPFFTTRTGTGGTGVGLSTARSIASSSGGQLRVTTAPGEGATFEVLLPTASAPERQGASIVVADDDPAVREVMMSTLEEAGYRVTAAADGSQALADLGSADLLVTDIDMPHLGGLQLIELLCVEQPLLPVLLVSGGPCPQLDRPLPFLAKPFTRAVFLAAVRAALDAAR